jgi:hypothetical protein
MKATLTILVALIFAEALGQRKNWAVPDFGVIQYAGSIGVMSAGAGYDVFKSRGRFSTHYGTIPKPMGGPLNVLAVKLLYEPVSLVVDKQTNVHPVDFGIMASYHYGHDFEERWPEQHGKGYYWWNPALRVHLVVESSITHEFPKDHRLNAATFYYEVNTNELYLVSYVLNMRTIRLNDILKVGAGVRIHF